ncbi:hypothetical protein QBC44DRAFT_311523 [Cladorrhinum sp. PSN332]|nr:hypothetical protein QBC44DRAFT_311523 [Cladorrhinum sp. PSN332]
MPPIAALGRTWGGPPLSTLPRFPAGFDFSPFTTLSPNGRIEILDAWLKDKNTEGANGKKVIFRYEVRANPAFRRGHSLPQSTSSMRSGPAAGIAWGEGLATKSTKNESRARRRCPWAAHVERHGRFRNGWPATTAGQSDPRVSCTVVPRSGREKDKADAAQAEEAVNPVDVLNVGRVVLFEVLRSLYNTNTARHGIVGHELGDKIWEGVVVGDGVLVWFVWDPGRRCWGTGDVAASMATAIKSSATTTMFFNRPSLTHSTSTPSTITTITFIIINIFVIIINTAAIINTSTTDTINPDTINTDTIKTITINTIIIIIIITMSNQPNQPFRFSIQFEHDYQEGVDLDVQVTALVHSLLSRGASFEAVIEECCYECRDAPRGSEKEAFCYAIVAKVLEIALYLAQAFLLALSNQAYQPEDEHEAQNDDKSDE